uniref:NADH dehydrogenase subunit 4 n=1 Tax=Laemonema goodebeanorum TaxID=630676 RepID=UPI0028FC7A57|nr:NADH dehydrogenase subunit 4 [Laemonema goodebeanorum]WNH37752.1 NADH dehydrogenase subunit 4 [Laemonema goodebeanorum]
MLKVIIPTMLLLPTPWLTSMKWLWNTMMMQSMFIALISLSWFYHTTETGRTALNSYAATDPLSTPLLVLSCWLLPLMIMASQHHLQSEPHSRQRMYMFILSILQFFLILAFSATEMIMFYIMFEATLIPTLLLITRWGNQTERLNAGIYFLFYTLAGSLPLLVALLMLQNGTGTLSLLTMHYCNTPLMAPFSDKIWWAACMIAFLVKMPLYGMHLWLPKAHVEAPIAGSMILAAVLLKLGGYGMMRLMVLLTPQYKEMIYPFIILALWGVIMTSTICLRQTDLKALIAYSSVSHMGLVAAGLLIQTPWGFKGALLLMIAHGLASSALFCLANVNYERIHSRTLLLARGLQVALPLMASWWLIASLVNMAMPPLPNLMGELMLIIALFNWSPWTLILTGAGALITAAYSLHMFLNNQRGPLPQHILILPPSYTREHLLLFLHLTPLFLVVPKVSMLTEGFS